MPNTDWFGTINDHLPILDFLFKNGECEIYESYSEIDAPLKKFRSADEILNEFENTYPNGEKWRDVQLLLRVNACSPPLKVREIDLRSKKFPVGSHRFSPEGLGFIQLDLSQETNGLLMHSHTNHNSRARAQAWAGIGEIPNNVDLWDFEGIAIFSGKLNRCIRKRGVAKIGSRVVLPEALDHWHAGIVFDQHHSIDKTPGVIVTLR